MNQHEHAQSHLAMDRIGPHLLLGSDLPTVADGGMRERAFLDRLPSWPGEFVVLLAAGAYARPGIASTLRATLEHVLDPPLPDMHTVWLAINDLATWPTMLTALSRSTGLTVMAPDRGLLFALGSGLDAGPAAGGTGWRRFAAEDSDRIGHRYPVPDWDDTVPREPQEEAGLVADPVLTGLLVRAADASPPGPDHPVHRVLMHPSIPRVVIDPLGPRPDPAALADLLVAWTGLGERFELVPTGSGDDDLDWVADVAEELGHPVVVTGGLPVAGLFGGPTTAGFTEDDPAPWATVLRAFPEGDQKVLDVAEAPAGFRRDGASTYRPVASHQQGVRVEILPDCAVVTSLTELPSGLPPSGVLAVGGPGEAIDHTAVDVARAFVDAAEREQRRTFRLALVGDWAGDGQYAFDSLPPGRAEGVPTPTPTPTEPPAPAVRVASASTAPASTAPAPTAPASTSPTPSTPLPAPPPTPPPEPPSTRQSTPRPAPILPAATSVVTVSSDPDTSALDAERPRAEPRRAETPAATEPSAFEPLPPEPAPEPATPRSTPVLVEPYGRATRVADRGSTPREQQQFATAAGEAFTEALAEVNAAMATWPSLRHETGAAAKADLAAVCLYLADGEAGGSTAVNGVVRTGTGRAIDGQVPCLVSGLRRLPTHRRAVLHQSTTVEPIENRRLIGHTVQEPTFLTASTMLDVTVPDAEVDVLIWPTGARRTGELLPRPVDEVVFLAGTRFKALAVRDAEGPAGADPEETNPLPRVAVLMRELAPGEQTPEPPAADDVDPLDERDRVALAKLERVLLARHRTSVRMVDDPTTAARLTAGIAGLDAPAATWADDGSIAVGA